MDLPIKFPSQIEVITEEVTRFRALSPEDRVLELEEAFRLYHFLASQSRRPDIIARVAEEEEERGRKAVFDFAARHGGPRTN